MSGERVDRVIYPSFLYTTDSSPSGVGGAVGTRTGEKFIEMFGDRRGVGE